MDLRTKRQCKRKLEVHSIIEVEQVTPIKQIKIKNKSGVSTNQKRALKKQRNTESQQLLRSKMSESQKEIARNKTRQQVAIHRTQETTRKNKSTKAIDRKRKQITADSMTPEQITLKKEQDRIH